MYHMSLCIGQLHPITVYRTVFWVRIVLAPLLSNRISVIHGSRIKYETICCPQFCTYSYQILCHVGGTSPDDALFSFALVSCLKWCFIFTKYFCTLILHRRSIDTSYRQLDTARFWRGPYKSKPFSFQIMQNTYGWYGNWWPKSPFYLTTIIAFRNLSVCNAKLWQN